MPKQRVERESREQIFEAAAAEFANRGFDAAGVDRIAANAGVNKAMIYYHFGSKLELYVEILRDMFRAVGTRARALAVGPGTPTEKIDAWVVAIVEEASVRPWFPPIMLRELASGIPHFDPETVGLMTAVYGSIRDIIAAGQRDGSFRDANPLLVHLTIMPAVLLFFVREMARARRTDMTSAPLAAPVTREEFIRHIQITARGMLRKD